MSYKTPAKTYFNRFELLQRCANHMKVMLQRSVIAYVSSIKDVASYHMNSDERKGKVCLEKINYTYDKPTDTITITYSIFDKFGNDILGEEILRVKSSDLNNFTEDAVREYVDTNLK